MEDWFIENFGAPYRNSVHVTGNIYQTEDYGSPFAIFPIGDFTFVWSPTVSDIAVDIKWPSVGGFQNVPPSQDIVDKGLTKADYRNTDLKAAIQN